MTVKQYTFMGPASVQSGRYPLYTASWTTVEEAEQWAKRLGPDVIIAPDNFLNYVQWLREYGPVGSEMERVDQYHDQYCKRVYESVKGHKMHYIASRIEVYGLYCMVCYKCGRIVARSSNLDKLPKWASCDGKPILKNKNN